jgi:hypothetical protein
MAARHSGPHIQRGGSTQDIATAGAPALCPQLARADISPKRVASRYDPERKSSARFCCDAQQLPSDMVGYHPRI